MRGLAVRPRLYVTPECRMDACELCGGLGEIPLPPPGPTDGESPLPHCACACHRPEHG